MKMLLSAWPALTLLLPVLWLVSVIVFLAKGNRRAVAQLMALLACFLIGALLMEFFTFMGALMARSGSQHATPTLGTGTRQLLETIANPRSITAPPLSLAAWAAYSIPAGYLWLLVAWGCTCAARRRARPKRSPPKARARLPKTEFYGF